ncbi:extracellular solute-binding protein [uncultured Ruegeria sp.]|uniref:extracellular solute-binding protein n=1 Tax=uncultured Ruegeria sp. TaxID=259304 RepID=UPI002629DEAE|nr:extracellular solute-binding protein [uncultured Ruegeria sp.]
MFYKASKTLSAALLAGTFLSGAAIAEPVTIRMVLKDFISTNPNSVAHVERIEAALAEQGHEIDIEIVDLPASGYADALGIMLLSGDLPDLIYFQGGDRKIADQNVLEDWRPWIAETEHLKGALYPHNEARLDNYPYLMHVFPLRAQQPVIRTDWLEATGLSAPATVDEYTALLTAIRDNDLDGDGENNTFGTTAGGSLKELNGYLNPAFGITATWLEDGSGSWIHSQISAQERDKLAYYSQLYAEGLLDPEYITINWEAKEDRFYTGRVGVVSASRPSNVVVYQTKMNTVHPNTTLTLLDPPAGPGGQGLLAVDVSKEGRGWAMSALSENKEAVATLLDFMASPEGQFMEQFGLEGIHHVINGDQVEVLPDLGSWESPFMISASWTPPVELFPAPARQYLQNTQDHFLPDNAFAFPSELAAAVDATTNIYNEWAFKFVSGTASFDQWGEYVEAWKAAGGDSLIDHASQVLQ